MDQTAIEQQLLDLPLYCYGFFSPKELEFADRVRHICQYECPMYASTWACPPAVGTVEECRAKCLSYSNCLMISTITEVPDISDLTATLATRSDHEDVTNAVGKILREAGAEPYILSTEACAVCPRCAYLDGLPCRHPDRMHPCVESHGINLIPLLERFSIEFQYGQNVVTWVSLLFFS